METYDLVKKPEIQSEADRLRAQVMLGWPLEKRRLEQLRSGKEMVFLDFGCGPGVFTELVGESFPEWSVVGIDSNADLLPVISKSDNIKFLPLGDKGKIPLADAVVDIVYCRFLFQHLTNRTQALSEILRVLRPGGVVIVIDVDDRGTIFSPEQKWITAIYKGAEGVQESLNGDRFVGAKLPQIFTDKKFEVVTFEVIPMTNFQIGSEALLYLAFGLKRRFLEAAPETAPLVTNLDRDILTFSSIPGHVIYIPIFFCMARKPLLGHGDTIN